ncbi:hypothetical protein MTP99_006975 [Tenebrio molitor]|nr:hypothetical protein MTP99_006975 [Tenebrio molitor]
MKEPQPSRFSPLSRPVPSHCEGTSAIPLSSPHPLRTEQGESAASRSDRKYQIRATLYFNPRPEQSARSRTPSPKDSGATRYQHPLFVHIINKGLLVAHLFVCYPPSRALTADPRTAYAPRSYYP